MEAVSARLDEISIIETTEEQKKRLEEFLGVKGRIGELKEVIQGRDISRLSHKVIVNQLVHCIVHQLMHYQFLWDSIRVAEWGPGGSSPETNKF